MCATPLPTARDASTGRSGPTAVSRWLKGGYREWAKAILAQANLAPLDDAKTRFLETPPADLSREIAAWRAAGVERLVCGFLPDEVAWNAAGSDAEFDWFVTHWEFLPFRLSERVTSGRAETVVLATDSTTGAEPLCEIIAHAWADAAGLKFTRLDTSRCDETSIISALARAALVVNDVQNWSLGFAIDELAARFGQSVVRLSHPGYSPLRHGLLGQTLPPTKVDQERSLRALLAEPLAAARKRLLPYGNSSWFAGGAEAKEWQTLYGQAAVAAFWRGVSWNSLRDGVADVGRRWTNRAVGWAALGAAVRLPKFPSSACAWIEDAVVNLVVEDLRGRIPGVVRDQALPRWVRWSPKWIGDFWSAAGTSPALNRALARWVERGVELGAFGEPILTFARIIMAGPVRQELKHVIWAPILAWSDDWTRVLELPIEGPPLPGWIRRTCAEVLWSRLQEKHITEARTWPAVLETLQADDVRWRRYLGAAGSTLRVLVALRCGRRDLARRVVRAEFAVFQIPVVPGWSRVVRVAFLETSAVLLVRQLGSSDAAGCFSGVLNSWYQRRFWDLHRRDISDMVVQEARIAQELLRRLVASSAADALAWRLRAMLSALFGSAAEAKEALLGWYKCCPGKLDGTPNVVAAYLALRGCRAAAVAILEEWPIGPQDFSGPLYARALAAQLAGDLEVAAAALARLREQEPRYLLGSAPTGDRWAWAALVFRHAGCRAMSDRMLELATRLTPASRILLEGIETDGIPLAEGWLALVRLHEGPASGGIAPLERGRALDDCRTRLP